MKEYIATADDKETPFQIDHKGDSLTVVSDGRSWTLDVHTAGPSHYSVIHEGKSHDIRFFREKETVTAFLDGEHLSFQLAEASRGTACPAKGPPWGRAPAKGASHGTAPGPVEIRALMPGKVVKVIVKNGDVVDRGSPILVVEAMKMENEMTSPKAGKVTELKIAEGSSVESGALLAVIE